MPRREGKGKPEWRRHLQYINLAKDSDYTKNSNQATKLERKPNGNTGKS